MKKFLKWGLGIIVIFFVIAKLLGGDDSTENNTASIKTEQQAAKEVVYTEVNANDLINLVNQNALKAKNEYKDKDLKIINCKVGKIDSDGDVVNFDAPNPDKMFSLTHIRAKVDTKDKALQEQIMNLQNDEIVTIYIHVNDIGDTLGVKGKLIKIEK